MVDIVKSGGKVVSVTATTPGDLAEYIAAGGEMPKQGSGSERYRAGKDQSVDGTDPYGIAAAYSGQSFSPDAHTFAQHRSTEGMAEDRKKAIEAEKLSPQERFRRHSAANQPTSRFEE